jgi:hypothetical protein
LCSSFSSIPVTNQNFRLIIDHNGESVVDGEFERKKIMLVSLNALRGAALERFVPLPEGSEE